MKWGNNGDSRNSIQGRPTYIVILKGGDFQSTGSLKTYKINFCIFHPIQMCFKYSTNVAIVSRSQIAFFVFKAVWLRETSVAIL